jgi:HPt (histidine-containing phosphotransfer) domain-containing protein
MDMFMPVMDGLEASSKIMALNTGTPIIAVTANVMTSELDKYKKHGMPDCLGKPFASQELWQVLLKYLSPLGSGLIDEHEDSEELQRKLRVNFVKNNKNVHSEITDAVTAGDITLAHRLAHSLKGNAGLIGKPGLRNIASELESLLSSGAVSVWDRKMNVLKNELSLVLEELAPFVEESVLREARPALSVEQTLLLFEKLAPMLEEINPESVNLLDEVRAVVGGEELAQQIEDYDFESAAGTLAELRRKI